MNGGPSAGSSSGSDGGGRGLARDSKKSATSTPTPSGMVTEDQRAAAASELHSHDLNAKADIAGEYEMHANPHQFQQSTDNYLHLRPSPFSQQCKPPSDAWTPSQQQPMQRTQQKHTPVAGMVAAVVTAKAVIQNERWASDQHLLRRLTRLRPPKH